MHTETGKRNERNNMSETTERQVQIMALGNAFMGRWVPARHLRGITVTNPDLQKQIDEACDEAGFGEVRAVPDAGGRFFLWMARSTEIKTRLEYLRGELRAERISYGELIELQALASYIDAGDVELLEAAGVPERTA